MLGDVELRHVDDIPKSPLGIPSTAQIARRFQVRLGAQRSDDNATESSRLHEGSDAFHEITLSIGEDSPAPIATFQSDDSGDAVILESPSMRLPRRRNMQPLPSPTARVRVRGEDSFIHSSSSSDEGAGQRRFTVNGRLSVPPAPRSDSTHSSKSSSKKKSFRRASNSFMNSESQELASQYSLMFEDDEDEGISKNLLYDMLDGKHLGWKRRLRDVFEGRPHQRDTLLAIVVNFIILFTIAASSVVFCVQSLPERNNIEMQDDPLFFVETVCIGIFITEVILRITVAKKWGELYNTFFAIDLLAIAGYFVDLTLELATSGAFAGFSIVRIVRLIRVFRVLKLSRHSKSLQLVYIVLRSSAAGLVVLLLPSLLIVTVFGCAIYLFELLSMDWNPVTRRWEDSLGFPSAIQSIPDAIWLCAETITTVGYGDVVPRTVGGKVCAILVQFTGVLLLSFPNIVLGGNMQFIFKNYHRYAAIRVLGRKFRKVWIMLVFINELKARAEARRELAENDAVVPFEFGGDAIAESGSEAVARQGQVGRPRPQANRNKKLPTNYLIPKSEVEAFRKDDLEPIVDGNVRSWEYKGISAISMLQRLLELCSGVGTTQELQQSYHDDGKGVQLKDVDVVALYLMEAGLLQLFAFKKFGTIMLCSLTPASVMELQLHAEEGVVECMRSAEVARVVWRRTVGTTVAFSLTQLYPTYQQWACGEKLVDNDTNTPVTDLKNVHDPQKAQARALASTASFRRGSVMRRPTTGGRNRSGPAGGASLEEAKARMRSVLEQQVEQIRRLQHRLREAEQQVTNMYGL